MASSDEIPKDFMSRLVGLFLDHSWEVADRTFKLLSWVFLLGVALAFARELDDPTALLVVRGMILLWVVAVFAALFNGTAWLVAYFFGEIIRLWSVKGIVAGILLLVLTFFLLNTAFPVAVKLGAYVIQAAQVPKH